MRILVCFKVVPDFDTVLRADWEGFRWDTDLFYAKKQWNPFDESALELALDLRAGAGRPASCTAVTAAPALGAAYKKQLYAVGFDHVARIDCAYGEFSPRHTARLLADFALAHGFDLILTGVQSGYADTGLVPPTLAELLGLPYLSRAEALAWEGGRLAAVHQTDFGGRKTLLPLPAVVSVGNSPAALRAATLRASLEAGKRALAVVEPRGGEPDFEAPVFSLEHSGKVCRFLRGDGAAAELLSCLNGGCAE